MKGIDFNKYNLAIIKLSHKIELVTDEATSVGILPCSISQIPYLPKVMQIISVDNSNTSGPNFKLGGISSYMYWRNSDFMAVIKTRDNKLYITTPSQIWNLDANGDNFNSIQAYASGYYTGKKMYLTHMYINSELVPESAKLQKWDYILSSIIFYLTLLTTIGVLVGSILWRPDLIYAVLFTLPLMLSNYYKLNKILYIY